MEQDQGQHLRQDVFRLTMMTFRKIMSTLTLTKNTKMTKKWFTFKGPRLTILNLFSVFLIVLINNNASVASSNEPFSLYISHWNNLHGHYSPALENGIGGLGGLVTALKQQSSLFSASSQNQNHIRLSSGDFLSPDNGWLSFFTLSDETSEDVKEEFFNLIKKLHASLNPTAVSATWSDFRFGVEITSKTVGGSLKSSTSESKSDFGAANYNPKNHDSDPILILSNIKHPYPKEAGIWSGFKIHTAKDSIGNDFLVGILGFFPPPHQNQDQERRVDLLEAGDGTNQIIPLIVQDVIPSLQTAIEQSLSSIRSNAEIQFFIAVGDCDPKLCQRIMDTFPQIRVIISGQSLGFEEKGGHILHSKNGGIIASAGVGGSSLGSIELQFQKDSYNQIKFLSVNSSLIPNTFSPDGNVTEMIQSISNLIQRNSTAHNILGQIEWEILEESCHKQCLLGNIVTDAMSRCLNRENLFQVKNDLHGSFSHLPIISIWHADGLTSEQRMKIPAFTDIRELDVHQWAPFLDSAKLFRFTGYDLKQLFNLYRENLYVSEHLRVQFQGNILEGIYHSDHDRPVQNEEELLVLIPYFLVQNNPKSDSLSFNFSNLQSYQTPRVDVRCVLKMFQETKGRITWGGAVRVKMLPGSKSRNWVYGLIIVLLLIGFLSIWIRNQRKRGHWNWWRRKFAETASVIMVVDEEGRNRNRSTSGSWPLIPITTEEEERTRT